MDFLNHIGVFHQVFLLSPLQCTEEVHKRLREFEEICKRLHELEKYKFQGKVVEVTVKTHETFVWISSSVQ